MRVSVKSIFRAATAGMVIGFVLKFIKFKLS